MIRTSHFRWHEMSSVTFSWLFSIDYSNSKIWAVKCQAHVFRSVCVCKKACVPINKCVFMGKWNAHIAWCRKCGPFFFYFVYPFNVMSITRLKTLSLQNIHTRSRVHVISAFLYQIIGYRHRNGFLTSHTMFSIIFYI